MLVILSPAKKQNFDPMALSIEPTNIKFSEQAKELIHSLRHYTPQQLKELMSISESLANLNFERFKDFDTEAYVFNKNAKPALFAFQGDAYQSLDAKSLTDQSLRYAQTHLALLSGLYGLLRPLDLIQPYRLEMKTKLPNCKGKDLYHFWGEQITQALNEQLSHHSQKILLNLASSEYFSAIQPQKINADVVTVDFKTQKGTQLKTIGILAKRARGAMARFIIENQADTLEMIKAFKEDGYHYRADLSTHNKLVFVN